MTIQVKITFSYIANNRFIKTHKVFHYSQNKFFRNNLHIWLSVSHKITFGFVICNMFKLKNKTVLTVWKVKPLFTWLGRYKKYFRSKFHRTTVTNTEIIDYQCITSANWSSVFRYQRSWQRSSIYDYYLWICKDFYSITKSDFQH